jgi:hypothetical protein
MKKSSRCSKNATSNRELDFPVIKEQMAAPSIRSIDEINTWIEEDYKLFFDRKTYEREKRLLSVTKIFTLD